VQSVARKLLIAFVIAGFIAYFAIPTLALSLRRDQLTEAVVECEEAKAESRRSLALTFEDELSRGQFEKSVNVRLLACLEKEVLWLKLRGIGVSEHRIQLVELEAIRDRLGVKAWKTRPEATQ